MKYIYEFMVCVGIIFCVARCGGPVGPSPTPSPSPEDKVAVAQIGTPALADHMYKWTCTGSAKLSDPNVAQPLVTAKKTTTCTVTATTKCGQAKSSMTLRVVKVVDGLLVEQTE